MLKLRVADGGRVLFKSEVVLLQVVAIAQSKQRRATMGWIAFWAGVCAVGVLGLTASINSLRFARLVVQEAAELWRGAGLEASLDRGRIDRLPPPVRTYLEKALGRRERAIVAVRFRHDGRFRTRLNGAWQTIRGEQYEAADPPGFVWWGRLRPAPGLWVDARDRSRNGIGGMLVSLESTVTLADRSGPEMDQGSLLRLLSDLVLFPTAFLDDHHVTWSSVDDRRARARLQVHGREVEGVFEFGADGLPRSFSAERYFDTGRGQAQLKPWSGDYADYREVQDGMLVPHHFMGYWHVDDERVPYVDFRLDPPEYDVQRPF